MERDGQQAPPASKKSELHRRLGRSLEARSSGVKRSKIAVPDGIYAVNVTAGGTAGYPGSTKAGGTAGRIAGVARAAYPAFFFLLPLASFEEKIALLVWRSC